MESKELALRMAGYPSGEDPSSGTQELAQILTRARSGDRAAFDQIIVLYQRRVLMTAMRLLGRLEDAQDAAQEVFLRLYKYLDRFDEKREMLPWLYRMTVNVCHDLRRRRDRTTELALEEARPLVAPSGADQDITLAERRRAIEAALKTLTGKEREALVLRDIEGLSTKEVARILGSSEGTVRSQVSMARLKIKKFVDRIEKRSL
jgi:RNA polymerase sigma-70 factor, ECF subfamily